MDLLDGASDATACPVEIISLPSASKITRRHSTWVPQNGPQKRRKVYVKSLISFLANWTLLERSQLRAALEKYGRLNVEKISCAIPTKSYFEVLAAIESIEDAPRLKLGAAANRHSYTSRLDWAPVTPDIQLAAEMERAEEQCLIEEAIFNKGLLKFRQSELSRTVEFGLAVPALAALSVRIQQRERKLTSSAAGNAPLLDSLRENEVPMIGKDTCFHLYSALRVWLKRCIESKPLPR